jgi:hypothetical protein
MDASVQLQLAAASYTRIYIHHTIVKNKKRKSPRWWMSQLYQSWQIYSGSSLMADLKFEHISGLYKNFTRMHPTDLEFFINAVGPSISRKDNKFRASIPVQERLAVTLRFLATGDSYTRWFTRNNEPGGIENATRNSSGEKPGHLPLRCPAFCCNVLWVAFAIPPGSLFLVNHPV